MQRGLATAINEDWFKMLCEEQDLSTVFAIIKNKLPPQDGLLIENILRDTINEFCQRRVKRQVKQKGSFKYVCVSDMNGKFVEELYIAQVVKKYKISPDTLQKILKNKDGGVYVRRNSYEDLSKIFHFKRSIRK